ncbi:MAG TPA: enolase C-terminal domain-like protein [Pseudolabrys sp.]|jgi:muconate cycloisomerase
MGFESRLSAHGIAGARPIVIRRVDAIPVALPLTHPMKMAHLTIATADNLLVRIESEDGVVGWGEGASAPTSTGETLPGMVATVRDWLAPALVGQDARLRAALMRRMSRTVYGSTGSKSAVEMALTDLVARTLNVPMASLLGGLFRDAVEPMWLLGGGDPAKTVEEARRKTEEGFTFLKLKAGIKPVEEEAACATAVRKAVGDKIKICADANSGFTGATARQYISKVADASLLFLEQTLPASELDALTLLARDSALPLCSDQSIHTIEDIDDHAKRGVKGVALKLIKLGGIEPLLKAAAVCESRGINMVIAAKVAESSIASAAIAHVACAVPLIDWGVSLTHVYLAEDVVKTKLVMTDGRVKLPDGAGFGLTVDEAAVERCRVRALS